MIRRDEALQLFCPVQDDVDLGLLDILAFADHEETCSVGMRRSVVGWSESFQFLEPVEDDLELAAVFRRFHLHIVERADVRVVQL